MRCLLRPGIANEDKYLISTLKDDPLLSPVIDIFIEELPNILQELENAIEEADEDKLKSISHQLKGASASAGFTALSEYVEKAETLIIEKRMDFAKEAIDEMTNLCYRVIKQQKSK